MLVDHFADIVDLSSPSLGIRTSVGRRLGAAILLFAGVTTGCEVEVSTEDSGTMGETLVLTSTTYSGPTTATSNDMGSDTDAQPTSGATTNGVGLTGGTDATTDVEPTAEGTGRDTNPDASSTSDDDSSQDEESSSSEDSGTEEPVSNPVEDPGFGYRDGLMVHVATAQGPAIPGQALLYTITIGNASSRTIEDVGVLFRVPAGIQFSSTEHADPDATGCGNSTCSETEEARWSFASIAPGSTETVVVNASVLAPITDDEIVAPVTFTAANLASISVASSTPVTASPQAELTLSADRDPASPGQEVTLDLDLGHAGSMSLFDGELSLTLPSGLSVVEISDDGSEVDAGRIAWPLGQVLIGESLHRSVVASVAQNLRGGELLNPIAEFTYEDGAGTRVSSHLPISVLAEPEPLSFDIIQVMSPVAPNGYPMYQVKIGNTSPNTAEGLRLIFRVPRELQFAASGQAEPDAGTCGNSTCSAWEEASWMIPSLSPGATETIEISPTVVTSDAPNGTLIDGLFMLRAPRFNVMNRRRVLPVDGEANAHLILDSPIEPIALGSGFTYTLHVGQIGATSLAQAQLEIELPQGVSVDEMSDGGTESGGVVSWSLGAVPVAGSQHRSVSVSIDEGVLPGAVLLARAKLTYSGGLQLDATSEFPVSVIEEPLPLEVTFDATSVAGVPGTRELYTTTLDNTSDRLVDALRLQLRVPLALQFTTTTDADPDALGCGNSTCSALEEAYWEVGTRSPGQDDPVIVNALILDTIVPGSLLSVSQRLTAPEFPGVVNIRRTIPMGGSR